MLEFNAFAFYLISSYLTRTELATKEASEEFKKVLNEFNPEGAKAWLKEERDRFDMINTQCEKTNLRMSAIKCKHIRNQLEKQMEVPLGAFIESYSSQVRDLRERIQDELSTQTFLAISPEEITYYTEQQFDQKIIDRCPKIEHDTIEAAKCYALGIYTACVFHLMRIIDSGMKSLVESLELELPVNPTWHAMLKIVRSHIDSLQEEKPERFRKKIDLLQHIYDRLDAIRHVWRNPTMHPERKYIAEEARAIFDATKMFMSTLVEGYS